jgi:hypothetical protein
MVNHVHASGVSGAGEAGTLAYASTAHADVAVAHFGAGAGHAMLLLLFTPFQPSAAKWYASTSKEVEFVPERRLYFQHVMLWSSLLLVDTKVANLKTVIRVIVFFAFAISTEPVITALAVPLQQTNCARQDARAGKHCVQGCPRSTS